MSAAKDGVTVVLVNWNGAADTIECLTSLRASTVPLRLIVVDNASGDDSVARLRATGLVDELIVATENLGFTGGNNLGLDAALASPAGTIVVLNNDTVVQPDAIRQLVLALQQRPNKAVSPDIRYSGSPEISWFRGGVIEAGWPRHLQPDEIDHSGTDELSTEWLNGCCIAASTEIWQRVGVFDSDFFLTVEDCEWSMRARSVNVELTVVPHSVIHHKVSQSFKRQSASLLGSYYFVRNLLRFQARYFPGDVAHSAYRWTVRATPTLWRSRRRRELMFRWLGLLGFATGRGGVASRPVLLLAHLLTAGPSRATPRSDRDG